MRRVWRWAFNGATVLCAVVSLSAAVMWFERGQIALAVFRTTETTYAHLAIENGVIEWVAGPGRRRTAEWHFNVYSPLPSVRGDYSWNILGGVKYHTFYSYGGKAVHEAVAYAYPLSLLAFVSAALPGTRLAMALRRRNRIRPGCCRSCGYDLTGNVSGVCPECGFKLRPKGWDEQE